ncbi:1,2-phenylacetyl-CoA epoxidase subunit PaaC [Croceibacter atlanticus]|jgi:ring-1,2-phenylacetyl-CoA epoxidase subunit PaaC|uniref:Phenylacetate-CoA oxygenase, PaaI subunit n=1 Tax=Croceibacter atlanticus (strain ATCC BAA-628 / JCM 21780 / CIP 108009 / IAM 15332 / KCTC 12090 / HTCC2559) TaxID=216432 RepID=A3U7D6_CROAH|nr:1,2-phenylacetyl-CoA epoxidase subunit PaaC [Croceibacter atlanticus]EAP88153.1 Phenylacetate-CoA oxygenase, PaaI subunit [Croceibacter atlanticus HTCC2559]MBW4971535.1 phenylacetate-CoA oxygenase subunit PaaC [Croceibacter atlanticus]
MSNQTLINYILGIADNSLILGQRLGTLTGHGPSLETDIACTNISLDLFGQVRGYYQYAADLSEEDKTEDDFAFLRKEREYKNVLLVEQPNRDFAYVIARQYLFDVFHILQMQELQNSKDENLAAIAKKGIKEVSYHVRFSGDWMKRLGDGTEESHNKIQEAVNNLWGYTNELFMMTEADKEAAEAGIGVDVSKLKDTYYNRVENLLKEATIEIPESKYWQKGGKEGIHTEHLGYLLSDMQYMQRTYPNMKW